MLNVEQAIAEVASVYQSLTGRPIEAGRYELPPEVDPLGHAETNYRQFKSLLEKSTRAGVEAHTQSGVHSQGRGPLAQHTAPAADVVELEREVRVHVDLPGVGREHVSVALAGDALTIRADRPAPRAQGGAYRLEERRKGGMLRTIALPPRARRDGIEATLRDGVLTISIPTDGTAADGAEIPVDVK
jgi:HSP20 family molecular chaperone IbpA